MAPEERRAQACVYFGRIDHGSMSLQKSWKLHFCLREDLRAKTHVLRWPEL